MATDRIVERLNREIAELDKELATGVTGVERQVLIAQRTDLYNQRNRLPLRSRVAA